MSSLDIYDFDDTVRQGTSTPTKATDDNKDGPSTSGPSTATTQPSLNEEVQQALGVLGSFWGGFRKQVSTRVA
jgi:hypothetical protein